MLKKVKIKEVEEWSHSKSVSSMEAKSADSESLQLSEPSKISTEISKIKEKVVDLVGSDLKAETGVITINREVKITFYRMKTFTEMFAEYFTNFEVLHQSLSPKFNRDMVFQAGEGAGRSGSFFFFSHDRKFIIKTIPKEELNQLLRLLPMLKEHFRKNPRSLLSKIFGVFTVKTKQMSDVHLMLQENILRFKKPENLRFIFDLKGSLVNREVRGKKKNTTTLKDVNFLSEIKSDENFM